MSDMCELLRVVSLNAASRYMAGTPSITDDSQIIMDAKNEIERLRARVAELEESERSWRDIAEKAQRSRDQFRYDAKRLLDIRDRQETRREPCDGDDGL